jgi:ferredoxin-NADP reductase
LQLCSDGVQKALKGENYEEAAVHIHRFLAMDQQLIKQTADEMAQGKNQYILERYLDGDGEKVGVS